MKENVSNVSPATPMLFPYEPEQFWQSIRQIIREEVQSIEKLKPASPSFETSGMTYKPLYKIAEVCSLFHIAKPTIYDWVKQSPRPEHPRKNQKAQETFKKNSRTIWLPLQKVLQKN